MPNASADPSNTIFITECPRDAMQGFHRHIPTGEKAGYLQQLLAAGFDTLDFGSFVSPKAIPQLADTREVLEQLDLSHTNTRLLAIIANERGAREAASIDSIHFLGYPFSVSEIFQERNTHASRAASLLAVETAASLCATHGKEMLVYLSMAFGNPYGEPWTTELVLQWAGKLQGMGIRHIALADTIGVSQPGNIRELFSALIPAYPEVTFHAHFHTRPDQAREKIEAALQHGCRHFDSAIRGFGGCPMAMDDLVGNLPTEQLLDVAAALHFTHSVQPTPFQKSMTLATHLFSE